MNRYYNIKKILKPDASSNSQFLFYVVSFIVFYSMISVLANIIIFLWKKATL